MAKKSGIVVPSAEQLGREFMKSPELFARARGLTVDQLECPDEVHHALTRAESLSKDIQGASIGMDNASMQKLDGIVSRRFGADHEVALVPFGLQFREKIKPHSLDITATGTGTITFKTDGDGPDVDD